MENKTVDVIIPAYHPGNEFTTLIKRLECDGSASSYKRGV